MKINNAVYQSSASYKLPSLFSSALKNTGYYFIKSFAFHFLCSFNRLSAEFPLAVKTKPG